MSKVTISLNGRAYSIACDDGQESRVLELSSYIDKRIRKIAQAGAASSEQHLLVLGALVLADELFAERNEKLTAAPVSTNNSVQSDKQQEITINAVEHLTERISSLADKIVNA